ncbi:MAG: hypothetical protein HQM16_11205 [Deltaproteobacteria bacterium]|nr:hypothetical protein [Deltaproteobacteria bacterium]
MKRLLSLILSLLLALTTPTSAWARNKCHEDSEQIESTSGSKPKWAAKTHYKDSQFEYFVGIATQITKFEAAQKAAIENGEKAIIESLGILTQPQYQEVSGLDVNSSDVRDALGSIGFPTFIKNREVEDVYYERWEIYSNCRLSYKYNIWALVKVPKSDLAEERKKAEAYLKQAQEIEMAKAPPELLPQKTVQKETPAQVVVNNDSANTIPSNPLYSNVPVKQRKSWPYIVLGMVIAVGLGAGTYYAIKEKPWQR